MGLFNTSMEENVAFEEKSPGMGSSMVASCSESNGFDWRDNSMLA